MNTQRIARIKGIAALAASLVIIAGSVAAQSTAAHPDFSGAWGPYRAGRGADPKLSPPAAGPIVLKGDYKKRYDERQAVERAATQRGEPLASPSSQCVPTGVPSMMSVAVYPVEVIQTPKQVTIIGEAFSEVRRVYMDKPQAKMGEVPPGYYGRSVGRWEGDTLVIDTIGIKESVVYKQVPHSDQMHITERIHLVAPDVMHDQITIEDPLALEQPITYTLAYRRLPEYEMVEFVCDNNREYVDDKGVVRMRMRNQ